MHLLCLHSDMHIWHEFVYSEDNWADEISRKGFDATLVRDLAMVKTSLGWAPLSWPDDMVAMRDAISRAS